jgi:hypothetical protein
MVAQAWITASRVAGVAPAVGDGARFAVTISLFSENRSVILRADQLGRLERVIPYVAYGIPFGADHVLDCEDVVDDIDQADAVNLRTGKSERVCLDATAARRQPRRAR